MDGRTGRTRNFVDNRVAGGLPRRDDLPARRGYDSRRPGDHINGSRRGDREQSRLLSLRGRAAIASRLLPRTWFLRALLRPARCSPRDAPARRARGSPDRRERADTMRARVARSRSFARPPSAAWCRRGRTDRAVRHLRPAAGSPQRRMSHWATDRRGSARPAGRRPRDPGRLSSAADRRGGGRRRHPAADDERGGTRTEAVAGAAALAGRRQVEGDRGAGVRSAERGSRGP